MSLPLPPIMSRPPNMVTTVPHNVLQRSSIAVESSQREVIEVRSSAVSDPARRANNISSADLSRVGRQQTQMQTQTQLQLMMQL